MFRGRRHGCKGKLNKGDFSKNFKDFGKYRKYGRGFTGVGIMVKKLHFSERILFKFGKILFSNGD